jgi:hypothetical protein
MRSDRLVLAKSCTEGSATDPKPLARAAHSTGTWPNVGKRNSIGRGCLVANLCCVLLMLAPGNGVAAQESMAFCEPQEMPAFRFGFQTLSSLLGDSMGTPIECEHADVASGDTLQTTSTGLPREMRGRGAAENSCGRLHGSATEPSRSSFHAHAGGALGRQRMTRVERFCGSSGRHRDWVYYRGSL